MVAFALTRIPGMLPQNFSAAYAIAFCAGVFFPQRLAWWVPLITLLITDLALNCYYQFHLGYKCFTLPMLLYMTGNYGGYAFLIWLGRRISSKASFVSLLSGGIFGALAFYFITNTLSWLLNPFKNPEYTQRSGRMDPGFDHGNRRLASHLGILSQYPVERRLVHRIVPRR